MPASQRRLHYQLHFFLSALLVSHVTKGVLFFDYDLTDISCESVFYTLPYFQVFL